MSDFDVGNSKLSPRGADATLVLRTQESDLKHTNKIVHTLQNQSNISSTQSIKEQ